MPQFAPMPASTSTPSRPASSNAAPALLPQLFAHAIGPLHTAYYQRIFTRFETLGRSTPTWNSAAALCTLGWCLLRGLWRYAALYCAALAALLALGWAAGWASWPLPVRTSSAALALLVLCCVPGFLGNSWYYRLVHGLTMDALTQSPTLAQTQQRLRSHASGRKHLALAALGQVLLWTLVALMALVLHSAEPTPAEDRTSTTAGPELHFPAHIAALAEADTPAAATATAPELPGPDKESTEAVETAQAADDVVTAMPTAAPPTIPVIPTAPATQASPATTAAVPTAEKTPEKAPEKALEKAPAQAAPKAPEKAAPKPTAKPPAPPAPASGNQFFVTLGTYADPFNAANAQTRAEQTGVTVHKSISTSNKGPLTRLRAGPFPSRSAAEQAQKNLQKHKLPTTIIEVKG